MGDGLYKFYLPNCHRNGLYHSKQVRPGRGRRVPIPPAAAPCPKHAPQSPDPAPGSKAHTPGHHTSAHLPQPVGPRSRQLGAHHTGRTRTALHACGVRDALDT